MIIDAFLYDGESEMLDARLRALAGVVDVHVAVIANRTHQGDVESFIPSERHRDAHGLVFHPVDLSEFDGRGRGGAGRPGYQVRERRHRDAIAKAVGDVGGGPGDLVLMGDVDEIPRAVDVQRVDRLLTTPGRAVVFEQRMHAFALDWLHPQCWLGTIALRLLASSTPQQLRDRRGDQSLLPQYPDGGWHLSWMGGSDACERKARRFSHAEYAHKTAADFDELRAAGVDINGARMVRANIDDVDWLLDWPPGLLDADPTYWRLP